MCCVMDSKNLIMTIKHNKQVDVNNQSNIIENDL